jgi:flagellar hook assembly protein FlgD
MEVSIHGFEASVGLPLSQIVEHAAAIQEVKAHGQGIEFKASVTKPDNLPSDIVRIEILDGNRRQVFLEERPKAKFAKRFIWNGLDAAGKPTEAGMHSIRVVAGNVLIAGHDYVLRRGKTEGG